MTQPVEPKDNGQKLQGAIGDSLFPEVQHVSDVKQVLELMRDHAQNLTQDQVRAILLLQELGKNEYLHGENDPYKDIVKSITGTFKVAVASPSYYLDTIEELIPKPPKPIILTSRGEAARVVGNGGGR